MSPSVYIWILGAWSSIIAALINLHHRTNGKGPIAKQLQTLESKMDERFDLVDRRLNTLDDRLTRAEHQRGF